ncbi:SDR family oxidoreductase [Erythrobacter sp.]|uniref:SDR family oxidoreductase n=1 Tax=Erythrobacter sp. TaxID=1042 RepID=UPI003C75B8D7
MVARETPRIVVSGATGVVGSALLNKIIADNGTDYELFAIVKNQGRFEDLAGLLGERVGMVKPIIADLRAPADLEREALRIGKCRQAVIVHCAADVSWGKTAEQLRPINVEGTMAVAQFAKVIGEKSTLIYVSSAYTRDKNWEYRNGYEETKAEAHRSLKRQCELPTSVFSCSLVVGDRTSGTISAFHGIYPLLKLASGSPPFVVGNPDCLVDIIPVDWTVSELWEMIKRSLEGETDSEVVAAAGDKRITLSDMFAIFNQRINLRRADMGLPEFSETVFVNNRRWEFLKRSMEAWKPEGLSVRDFKHFEMLLSIYRPYTTSDAVRPPCGLVEEAPGVSSYLHNSVDFWLAENATKLESQWLREARRQG